MNGFGESAKMTLIMGIWCGPGCVVFLFRALDRLKVGFGKGGDQFLVRVAGVLIAGGNKSCVGSGEYGGGDARPGFASLCVVVPLIDNVGVVVPDADVVGAGFLGAWLLGVRKSSRLLDEVELLEFLLHLTEVLLVPVDGSLSFALSPLFRE